MKKIGIIGSFGIGETLTDGQNVKSNNIYTALVQTYGEEQIEIVDTHNHGKQMVRLLFLTIRLFFMCRNIIMMPAQNGLRVYTPLLSLLNHISKRSLHYIVIGGWLSEHLKKYPSLTKQLKTFDGIYPETNTMKTELVQMGFNNVTVLPNFKDLPILSDEKLQTEYASPFRLCTFSRVMKQKGIADAIEAVCEINRKYSGTLYCLDIYGAVSLEYREEFNQLINSVPVYIQYKGEAAPEQSVEILKDYFLLLFPTRFETEGIPGTIIDAYASGVPVLAAKWCSFSDVVDDGVTGYGYPLGDNLAMMALLEDFANNPHQVIDLKHHCLVKAKEFMPEVAIKRITSRLSD